MFDVEVDAALGRNPTCEFPDRRPLIWFDLDVTLPDPRAAL
jgi:hypothetical protein